MGNAGNNAPRGKVRFVPLRPKVALMSISICCGALSRSQSQAAAGAVSRRYSGLLGAATPDSHSNQSASFSGYFGGFFLRLAWRRDGRAWPCRMRARRFASFEDVNGLGFRSFFISNSMRGWKGLRQSAYFWTTKAALLSIDLFLILSVILTATV